MCLVYYLKIDFAPFRTVCKIYFCIDFLEDVDWIIQENIYGEGSNDNSENDDGSSLTTSSSGDHVFRNILDISHASKRLSDTVSNLTTSNETGSDSFFTSTNETASFAVPIKTNISNSLLIPDNRSSVINRTHGTPSYLYNNTIKNNTVINNLPFSLNLNLTQRLTRKKNSQYKYKRKNRIRHYSYESNNNDNKFFYMVHRYDRDNVDVLKHLPNNISSLIDNTTHSIIKSNQGLFLKTNKTYVIPLTHKKLNKTAKSVVKDSLRYGKDLLFSTPSLQFTPLNLSSGKISISNQQKRNSSLKSKGKVYFSDNKGTLSIKKADDKNASISQHNKTHNKTFPWTANKTSSKTSLLIEDAILTNEDVNNSTLATIMVENKTPSSIPSNKTRSLKKSEAKILSKTYSPITNHENDLVKVIKLSKSESASRHNDRNFRDTVLKLNKHFGKTHRIVLDYSQGEENARLLIYLHNFNREEVLSKRSKIEKVTAHKKDTIVVEESAEKRMIGG